MKWMINLWFRNMFTAKSDLSSYASNESSIVPFVIGTSSCVMNEFAKQEYFSRRITFFLCPNLN